MTEYILTKEQMGKVDEHAIQTIGIPSMVLMERAAFAVTEEILPSISNQDKVLVLCGGGNNGGDGVAIARMLYLNNKNVTLLLLGEEEKASEETKQQLTIANNIGMNVISSNDLKEVNQYSIVFDAIFGIGLNRPVEGEAVFLIEKINDAKNNIISVDISSGLSADTGAPLGIAVKANQTVTFGWKKRGMEIAEGKTFSGEVIVKDIGYPRQSLEYVMTNFK